MPPVIIPCAKGKKHNAPTLTLGGNDITFVAQPAGVNERAPWDPIVQHGPRTWIHCVADYNNAGALNPVDVAAGVGISGPPGTQLFCAGTLYTASIYADLIQVLGFHHIFILSAGWGLVRADVRLPPYDVTFVHGNPRTHITPHRRSVLPKLFLPPAGYPTLVFASASYTKYLQLIMPAHPFVIAPYVAGGGWFWFRVAALAWLAGLHLPLIAPNGPCPCNCGFAIPNMHCNGQPFGGLVKVV
jgi:hypothetical protein